MNNLKKYEFLNDEFFAINLNWTYEFSFDGEAYAINIDDSNGKYMLYNKSGPISGPFKDIYEAIEAIKFNNKSIKELILETDFTFDTIG